MIPCPSDIRSKADLKQLQHAMWMALGAPLTNDNGLRGSFRPVAEQLLKPSGRLSAFDRLEIYARQYWFRLLDCLHDDYPGLRALVGQRRFHQLCRAYLADHPSESWTLRNLGSGLEGFIRAHPALAGARHRAAIDIARFEWAQVLAFDEAASKPVRADDLLGSDPTVLLLKLQHHISLLDLDYAVDDFFMAVRRSDDGLRSEASHALLAPRGRRAARRVPAPIKQRVWLVVHRSGNDLYFKRIEREAFLVLRHLKEGLPLSAALDAALTDADPAEDWPAKVRDWFLSWSALGWFRA